MPEVGKFGAVYAGIAKRSEFTYVPSMGAVNLLHYGEVHVLTLN